MRDILKGIVLITLFAIPFIPWIVTDSMFFPFITGKNFTFRILIEIGFAAWVLLALLDKMYRPRFSWILVSTSALLIVMFFANLFGEYPLKSFWSNFERMDGYVTLIHFYLLLVLLGSMFRTKKMWNYFFYASVGAALYVTMQGFVQLAGGAGGSASTWRVESTFGNAAYMAIYMLFQCFIVLWLITQAKATWLRFALLSVFVLFVYILIQTATRGTFLGLIGGSTVMIFYLAIFSQAYPQLRKIAIGGAVALVVVGGTFIALKETTFVQESPVLARFANISIDDLNVRFTVWGMALEGVKERPILGWGQGNFNYVFNEQYDPAIYFAESWYDRAHNIMFDWLVAGGILGFLAYMSILFACVYYVFLRPLFKKKEDEDPEMAFSVTERAVLIGLLAGYFVHNLVVFDNIVSYMFFAIILGLIHSRVAVEMPKVQNFEIDSRIVTNIATPVVIVLMGTIIYFAHVPAIQASRDLIHAFTSASIPDRLTEFDTALKRDSFAYQEVVEQLAQQAMQIGANRNIPVEQKTAFIARAEQELENLALIKPGDARVHVFTSGFYRNVGAVEEAKKHIDIARELSPDKQAIILEQGIIAFQMGDHEAMSGYFKEAYDLDNSYRLARFFYAASLLYIGKADQLEEVITDEYFEGFARNEFCDSICRQNWAK